MILPHSYNSLVLLMILSLLCWGSWPNFYKLTRQYRFELFYFDFAFGLALAVVIGALTWGSLGFDGFTVTDDILNAGKRQWLFGFVAGVIFNFGNLLLVAAVSVAGVSVAFLLSFGVATILSVAMGYFAGAAANGPLLLLGCGLTVCSVILTTAAYSRLNRARHEAQARAGLAKSTRRPSSVKGVVLALAGGVLLGSFSPLLVRAQNPDIGLGPYATALLFGMAVMFSTFVFNLFFMNLPVEGDPLEVIEYFRGSWKNHFWGFVGGVVWAVGAVAVLVATTPKGDTRLDAPLSGLPGLAAPLVAALWGLLVWREFKGGDRVSKLLAVLMWLLFAGGVAAVAVASTAGGKR